MARSNTRRRDRSLWSPLVCGALLGTVLAVLFTMPSEDVLSMAVAQPPVAQYQDPVTPASAQQPKAAPQPAANPLDTGARLINDAAQKHARITDYTCVMISQERVKGVLKPENVIAFHMKPQPFSIYMKWLGPKDMVGQEVAFVEGKNNGKMRVHTNGALVGAFGFISLDVNDARVMEHSRHTIREAGLGSMIAQLQTAMQTEQKLNKTVVCFGEFEYNKRRCTRMELIRTERNPAFYCYRTVVYFDKELGLPIRMESYDWPRQGGPQEGELLECFSYIDLRFNVGLNDQFFSK